MPTMNSFNFPRMDLRGASLEQIVSYLMRLQDSLEKIERDQKYLLENLDSSNALEFGGYFITDDQIASRNGLVGLSSAVTGGDDIRIWAGDQLTGEPPFRVYEDGLTVASNAVITGTITALAGRIGGWLIVGNVIESAAEYPKVRLDPTGHLVGVYHDEDTYIIFQPDYLEGIPVINYHDGAVDFWVGYFVNQTKFAITTDTAADIELSTFGDIRLSAGNSLHVPDWPFVQNMVTDRTLQQEFDDIRADINDLEDRVSALEGP